MFTTRVFEDAEGQAVLIPDEIAFEENGEELIIERRGDVTVIYPASSGIDIEEAFERVLTKIPG